MKNSRLSYMKRGGCPSCLGLQCQGPSFFYIIAPSSMCVFLFMVHDDCLSSIFHIHILLTHLMKPVQPVAEVALGPGACYGLSWDTGLELGVDVAQRAERLFQGVPQGRVSHGPQHLQRQGQLSLQGHGALPHLQPPQVPGLGERVGTAAPVL